MCGTPAFAPSLCFGMIPAGAGGPVPVLALRAEMRWRAWLKNGMPRSAGPMGFPYHLSMMCCRSYAEPGRQAQQPRRRWRFGLDSWLIVAFARALNLRLAPTDDRRAYRLQTLGSPLPGARQAFHGHRSAIDRYCLILRLPRYPHFPASAIGRC